MALEPGHSSEDLAEEPALEEAEPRGCPAVLHVSIGAGSTSLQRRGRSAGADPPGAVAVPGAEPPLSAAEAVSHPYPLGAARAELR